MDCDRNEYHDDAIIGSDNIHGYCCVAFIEDDFKIAIREGVSQKMTIADEGG